MGWRILPRRASLDLPGNHTYPNAVTTDARFDFDVAGYCENIFETTPFVFIFWFVLNCVSRVHLLDHFIPHHVVNVLFLFNFPTSPSPSPPPSAPRRLPLLSDCLLSPLVSFRLERGTPCTLSCRLLSYSFPIGVAPCLFSFHLDRGPP